MTERTTALALINSIADHLNAVQAIHLDGAVVGIHPVSDPFTDDNGYALDVCPKDQNYCLLVSVHTPT